jgi:spore germination protein GerM
VPVAARSTTALAVLCLAISACGIPADQRVTPIGNDDLGPELIETTTTSTTSTSTTSTTIPGPTSPDESSSTSSSTTLAPATTEVTLYYLIGNTELLTMLRQPQLGNGPAASAVVAGLLASPTADLRSSNLRTSVRPGLLLPEKFEFDDQSATLTVALDGAVFDSMPEEQRRRAIGQIVLTFTSNPFPNRGNIGSVRFAIDGEPIAIVLPSSNTATAEGEPVTFADFTSLLDPTGGVTGPDNASTSTSAPTPDSSTPG